jgi:hypothetical protein
LKDTFCRRDIISVSKTIQNALVIVILTISTEMQNKKPAPESRLFEMS